MFYKVEIKNLKILIRSNKFQYIKFIDYSNHFSNKKSRNFVDKN